MAISSSRSASCNAAITLGLPFMSSSLIQLKKLLTAEFAENSPSTQRKQVRKKLCCAPDDVIYPQRFSLRSQRLFSAHSAVKGFCFYFAASTPAPTSDS